MSETETDLGSVRTSRGGEAGPQGQAVPGCQLPRGVSSGLGSASLGGLRMRNFGFSGRSSSRCDLETCTSVCFLPDVVRAEGAARHAAFHIAAAALALAGVAASLGLARYLCRKRTAVVNR